MSGLWRWLYTFFPSSIELIVHLDTVTDTYETIYKKRLCDRFWSTNTITPRTGYFCFKIWNHRYQAFDYVVLSHFHLESAMGNVNITFLSEGVFISKLLEYVKDNQCSTPHAIMEILIDNKDVYMDMYPFLRSIYVVDNATPHMINLMYSWLTCTKGTYRHVELTDYNYHPYQLTYNQFVFTKRKVV